MTEGRVRAGGNLSLKPTRCRRFPSARAPEPPCSALELAELRRHLGYVLNAGPWELGGFARVDNPFARKYAGSVIVNEGNSRFFEPAPGRTWLASVSATLKF